MQSAYASVQAIIAWTSYAFVIVYLWVGAASGVAEYRAQRARGLPAQLIAFVTRSVWIILFFPMLFARNVVNLWYDWGSTPHIGVLVVLSLAILVVQLAFPRTRWGGTHLHTMLLFRQPDSPLPTGRRRLREALAIGLAIFALTGVTLTSLELWPCDWLDRELRLSGCERAFDAGGLPRELALSADGSRLAGLKWNEPVIWSTADGHELVRVPNSDNPRALALSPDGQLLAVSFYKSPIRILRTDGSLLRELPAAEEARDLAFSPDGRLLAAAAGGSVVVWRVDDGRQLWSQEVDGEEVYSVTFSPDGRALATGAYEGAIQVWGAEGGELRQTLDTSVTYALAFSPDGALLAAASYSYGERLDLWRVRDGQLLWRYKGGHREAYMWGVGFTPDGAQVLGGSGNSIFSGQVVARRVADGSLAGSLSFPGAVESLAVRPGGQVAIGLWDDSIRIWRLPLPDGGRQ